MSAVKPAVSVASAAVTSTGLDEIVTATEINMTNYCNANYAANDDIAAPVEYFGRTNDSNHNNPSAIVCRYFIRGICRFGAMCRFSHNLDMAASHDECNNANANNTDNTNSNTATNIDSNTNSNTNINTNTNANANTNIISTDVAQAKPGTSRSNWANAPVFVPSTVSCSNEMSASSPASAQLQSDEPLEVQNKSWAEVVGANDMRGAAFSDNLVVIPAEPGSMDGACPYDGLCPYGPYCVYSVHLEQCKLCDQYCLHPTDMAQRRKHNQDCLEQHEQAMELSFAIARSKDKTCGICFDTIIEKTGREKRFGILPNCSHIFCLECIRTWRQAKQFEHKITRSCPECRVSSDFVCPSAFWVDSKEEKEKLLTDYRSALGIKDCKYFKKGDGKCPFGNKCFYKHALPNGELVDVGCPKRARRIRGSTNEFMNLIDIYLWEFVEQRDYHWLELLSGTSDDGDSNYDV